MTGNGIVSDSAGSFIELRELTKRFGDQIVLDGVSLDVAQGRTLALLGPSGCGKTTILRCMAGLETADAGSISVAGQTVFDAARRIELKPEQRQLGIVFQSYAVWPHMTVAENVGFPLKVRGIARAEAERRVAVMLGIVGLGAWGDRSATQLSGGQQQRVALARALIHEPKVVLFDEALSNLDTQLREQMRVELRSLQERLGFTAIYVTHDQTEAFALADTVVILNRGKAEAVGSPQEVADVPRTAFVARFLGFNVIEGTVAEIRPGGSQDGALTLGRLALKSGEDLWGRLAPGARIELGATALACIRKEHLQLSRRQGISESMQRAAPIVLQELAGRILTTSFLGATEEVVVDFAESELRILQPAMGIERNTQVTLRFASEKCFLLEKTGG